MQQALRFLEAVLPASGLRVVASKPPRWTKGLKHIFVGANEDVIRETLKLDQAGVTNYMALATYADPDAGRTATNTVQLQCLWLDVDHKNYDNTEAADADLVKLAQRVGPPTIKVNSGGGYHAYWVLRSPMPTAEWKPLADAFQAAWQALEIKADPISADAARILRLPGSHNFKPEYGEPREVVIESFDDVTYDAAALAKKLGTVGGKNSRLPIAARPIPVMNVPTALLDVNDDLGAGFERRESHLKPMIAKCLQVQYAYAKQAELSEPQWFAVVQLTRHLVDGRRVSHVFSNKHPDYSAQNTEAKLNQLEAKDIGPTTCAKFRVVNPQGCVGCQYNITSPIQLGYKEIEAVEPVVTTTVTTVNETGQAVVVQREERPEVSMPHGFTYDGQVMYRKIKDQLTGLDKDEPIFRGFLCPERLVTNERDNHATEIQLYVQSEGQPPKRITIPGKSLSEKRDLGRELSGKGILFMTKHSGHILDMLQKMTQEIQSKRRDAAMAVQMGWQDDDMFVVGSTGYRREGPPLFDLPVPASTKAVVRNYEPAGSFEAWKRTAAIYNHPGAEPYQFALCYGAAGILLPETSESGVVLALYSQAAGRGKSTAGDAALSWWGNPKTLKSQSKDTNNALFNKASRHKNLPLLLDEITDKPSWELEDLVYFMCQGREKERLTSESVSRPILPSWSLPVIATSNNSIKAKLQSKRGDTQGLFARIIEVPMDLPFAEQMAYNDRRALASGFKENYGHAGPMLVKHMMNNRALYRPMLESFMASLDKTVGSEPGYRFWVASCAATLVVAAVARQLGILQYDLAGLSKWTAETLRAQRSDTMTSIATSEDILAQFLEQNANRIIVSYIRNMGVAGMVPAVWPENGVHGSQLVGRVEVAERSLYISMSAFMRFCHDAGYDPSAFVRNAARMADPASGETLLKKSGPVSANLGRGTKTASAKSKALQFNLLHPALREFAMGIDNKITEVSQLKIVGGGSA